MPVITVVAKVKAKPGKEAALARALRALIAPTHREEGCLRYALNRSLDDPATFVMIEKWTSREALDSHLATPHLKAYFEKAPALSESWPIVDVFEPLTGGDKDKGQL